MQSRKKRKKLKKKDQKQQLKISKSLFFVQNRPRMCKELFFSKAKRACLRGQSLPMHWLLYFWVAIVVVQSQANSIRTFSLTYTNDIAPVDAYEHVHFVSALAGVVNRQSPQLYLFYTQSDQAFWNL